MFLPVTAIGLESVYAQFSRITVFIFGLVGTFPDVGKLILVGVGSWCNDRFTTCGQGRADRSPKLSGNGGPHISKLIGVEQGNTHTPSCCFGCCGTHNTATVFKVYWAFVVACDTCSNMVWAQFISKAYALHDLLSTCVLVCCYQDSWVRHKHTVPQQVSCCTGWFACLSRHHGDWIAIVMIGINQLDLILKRMIQHFALCGVLYMEKVIHKVVRPCNRISTLQKLIQLLICECLVTMRRLDQYGLKWFCHDQVVILNLPRIDYINCTSWSWLRRSTHGQIHFVSAWLVDFVRLGSHHLAHAHHTCPSQLGWSVLW